MPDDLYQLLRSFRNKLSDQLGLPPYRILTNQAIEELASKQPTTHLQLHDIKGFGPVKISQYGQQFLDIISTYQTGTTQTVIENNPSSTSFPPSANLLTNSQDQPYIFSIAEYLELTNGLLSQAQVVIQGEVTSISDRGNYVFFTLTDPQSDAHLSCFLWGHKLQGIGITIKEGQQLKAQGFGRIYPARGSFSFEVNNFQLVGEGSLQNAYQELLDKLSKEGLFDPALKTPLPAYPHYIGIITSRHGEAITDFKTHLGNYRHQVHHYHVHVEGFHAESDITTAIRYFNEHLPHLDCLVITRGGGSLESLAPYNSAILARAIRASRIPVLTAIGHHSDQTIADLVADVTCSTPTAAGRYLADPWQQVTEKLATAHLHLQQTTKQHLQTLRLQLDTYSHSFPQAIQAHINHRQAQLTATHHTLTSYLKQLRTHLHHQSQLINSHDPHLRLSQGYSITTNAQGHIIKSSSQLNPGDNLYTQLHQGSATSIVKNLSS